MFGNKFKPTYLFGLLFLIILSIAGCTSAGQTPTSISATRIEVLASSTPPRPTATIYPPTATRTQEPTDTPLLPTATHEPTATSMPPTATPLPPLSESGGGVIAYVSEQSGRPGIYVMNADGSDQRQLTDDFDRHPDWSPDSQEIAFSTRRSDVVAIYTIDLVTQKVKVLTSPERSPSDPDWSPNGDRFAFTYNPTHPGIVYEIFLMDADGKSFVQLTDSAGYQSHSGPDWSPDGLHIAFSADTVGNDDIYKMNSEGSNVSQLTFSEADDRSPAWSPDGSLIAFQTLRDGNWEIYVMNTDGSQLKNITINPGRDQWPSWSPDGSRIVYQSDRDRNWEIYVMNADGSDQRRLTVNEVADTEPAWRP